MELEKVNPIDPHSTQGSTADLHVLDDANAGYTSQDLSQRVRREHVTFGVPGQRTACAATQGMPRHYLAPAEAGNELTSLVYRYRITSAQVFLLLCSEYTWCT